MQSSNASRLQRLLNGFDFLDDQYSNTEELANYLDAEGVVVPPCKYGAEVWAYILGGLNKCKVTKVTYNFEAKEWVFCVTAGGFPFCTTKVYSSKEGALNGYDL